jgi:hypothetical protein
MLLSRCFPNIQAAKAEPNPQPADNVHSPLERNRPTCMQVGRFFRFDTAPNPA